VNELLGALRPYSQSCPLSEGLVERGLTRLDATSTSPGCFFTGLEVTEPRE